MIAKFVAATMFLCAAVWADSSSTVGATDTATQHSPAASAPAEVKSSADIHPFLPVIPVVAAKTPLFSGWGWYTLGRVQSSQYDTTQMAYDFQFENEWLYNFETGLKMVSPVGSHSKARLHAAIGLYYSVPDQRKYDGNVELLVRKTSVNLLDATWQSDFAFHQGRDTLTTEFGYFPVKYNPQSRNLGEYLFRSTCYPAVVMPGSVMATGFELADKVKLGGVHVSYKLNKAIGDQFKQDVYLYPELDYYPMGDISFAYLADYKPAGLVDIGFGADWSHMISLDNRRTTPGTDTVTFKHYNEARIGQWNDSTMQFDSTTIRSGVYPAWTGYVDPKTHDTTWYTFAGVKIMVHLTIDPKWFFKSHLFGSEDLKLYAELDILGWQNYPGWYENRLERMPVVVGFNVPCFKLLDVLAVEGEWFGSKYWNSMEFVWKDRSPVPYTGNFNQSDITSYQPKIDDDIKWSVYAAKKIGDNLRASFQVASDHTMRTGYMSDGTKLRYTEMVPRTQDWYFMGRIAYMF